MSVQNDIHESLSPFDHCVPRCYYNTALYLPLKPNVLPQQAFNLLQEALHHVFVRLP